MATVLDKRAPGRRLIKRLNPRTKYWLVGGASALLIGSGLSVLSEAAYLKHDNAPLAQWFLMGLYGYILTIGGLGIMQISTRIRVRSDVRREIRRQLKKYRKSSYPAPRRDHPKKESPFG